MLNGYWSAARWYDTEPEDDDLCPGCGEPVYPYEAGYEPDENSDWWHEGCLEMAREENEEGEG